MSGELGKASLELEADLRGFDRNMEAAHGSADHLQEALDALAIAADVAKRALNDVSLGPSSAVESRVSAQQILAGVHGISDGSRIAALEIDRVKLTESQAAETEAAGAVIDHELDNIETKANRTRRALERIRLGLSSARNGVGVGPFGSGFGRIGLGGSAIGAAALTLPAAGPGALGLIAGIPAVATMAAGALGVLALAGQGVAKAIGGDKKAFDGLSPAAQKFVLTVRSLDGWMDKLRQTAAKGLFPGLEQGLRSALSPGTVSVITMAVSALATALGHAGEEWGKYFGSPEFQRIFGPLMLSAARNIGVLSDAALHFFDFLGVLARGAIPFTNWLTSAIDKGSKLADSWIHAKDASGELAHGMDDAEKSLTLVWHLAGSLVGVVIALGAALYPVSNVAVKDLTDGLDALAGIINRNKDVIRGVLGAALDGLKTVIEGAAKEVQLLTRGLSYFTGPQKARLIVAIGLIGAAITLALGPESAAVVGALLAVGLIRSRWTALGRFFAYEWEDIQAGAYKAVLGIVEPFSHLPGVLGGWARNAKNNMQHQLDKLHAPNMDWSGLAAKDGALTGFAWRQGFEDQLKKNRKRIAENALSVNPVPFSFWLRQHPGGTRKQYDEYVKALRIGEQVGKETLDQHKKKRKKPHYTAPTFNYTDPFGKPPPFTTNTGTSGSKSVIPQSVSQLDALAARQDQAAAALNYAGAAARKHLDEEILDLQKADRILEEKLKKAHGRRRTELYNALTANLKKIAEARKRVGDAITKGRQADLNLALDQAKAAVEKAQEGSKAWDRAITAEEAALRAEIRYWDKRAHNMKLSADARDAALKKEISYEHELKQLLTQRAQAVTANESQFLQSFVDIQNTFAPNAVPYQGGSSQTDTHLYDIKNESRQQTKHLKAIRDQGRFPGSRAGHAAAMAVNT